ncbi:MAG: SDR family oxidoreductase [Thermoanaerobaculia bacterium]|nr:SDR family oxidoreductase [Thermoanaerobaculia bacterium]
MPSASLAGQVAIVTGASSGIGRAIAAELAGAGAHVVLAARRQAELETVVAELAHLPGSTLAVPTDVADESAIERLVARAIGAFGRLDILVNAAGIGGFGLVHKLDAALLDRVWAVNVRGAILAAKHVVPILAGQGQGAIVNIGSVSSKRGWPQGTPYVASKFALRGFTECLRQEVRDSGVRVVLVCPDLTATGFFAASGVALSGREAMLEAEEVAATVRFALELPPGADLTELDLFPAKRPARAAPQGAKP